MPMDGENFLWVLFVVRVVGALARPLSLRLQGRSPAAPARRGPSPRRDRELKTRSAEDREREIRRVHDHQGQGLSGEWAGVCPRPGASAEPRPLARGRCRARRPTPGRCPCSRRPVVARRYASLRHRASRAVRVTRPTVPTILSPWKIAVWGAPSGRVPSGWRKRHPRLRPPTADPLAPIRLDGAGCWPSWAAWLQA